MSQDYVTEIKKVFNKVLAEAKNKKELEGLTSKILGVVEKGQSFETKAMENLNKALASLGVTNPDIEKLLDAIKGYNNKKSEPKSEDTNPKEKTKEKSDDESYPMFDWAKKAKDLSNKIKGYTKS